MGSVVSSGPVTGEFEYPCPQSSPLAVPRPLVPSPLSVPHDSLYLAYGSDAALLVCRGGGAPPTAVVPSFPVVNFRRTETNISVAVPVEIPQNVTVPVNGTSPAPQSSLAPSSTGAVYNSTSLSLSVTSGASTPSADPSSATKAAAGWYQVTSRPAVILTCREGPVAPTDPVEPVSSESEAASTPTSPSSVARTSAAPASTTPVTTSAVSASKAAPSVPVDKPVPDPPASETSVQSASPVNVPSSVESTSTPVSKAPTSVAQKPTSIAQKPGLPSEPAQPTSPELGQSSPVNTMSTDDGGRPQNTQPTSSAGDKDHDSGGDGGKPAPSSTSPSQSPSASGPISTHSTENASPDPGNGSSSTSDSHVTSSPSAPQSSSAAPVSSKPAQGASPASAGAGTGAGASAPASPSSQAGTNSSPPRSSPVSGTPPAEAAASDPSLDSTGTDRLPDSEHASSIGGASAAGNAKAKGPPSVTGETNTAPPDITSTSTITDQPESTFARPVSIPVTTGGSTVLTAPPFITSLATSTEPNGVVTTITHIIANPTNGLSQDLQRHSFFDNHGAVIGVFLAVGIVTSLAGAVLLWLCCRRRKEKKAHRLESQSPTLPSHDPFLDPVEEPRMSMIADRRSAIDWTESTSGAASPAATTTTTIRPGFDVAGSAHVYPHINDSYDGPFSDYHQVHARHLATYAMPDVSREDVRFQSHSRARSTPSLYPPSVIDDTADSLYEREMRAKPPPSPRNTVESSHFRALSADAAMMTGVGAGAGIGICTAITSDYVPIQRGNVTTPTDYEPASLTPPMSVSSHMTSQLESPTTPTSPSMGHNTPPDEALQRKLPPLKQVAAGAFLRRTYSKAGIRREQRE
ncbi:hypothetical protein EVG20_g4357 [Dentipellis fragilis]|uniref:Uncharacterized protein n=1 Tax=Dentipellis fragilis TaxID=205917 RepID=A0A4Y9YYU5_9AGAM|nr:hypothetical protein EVG20_g4357 [Dentipellis fragilis]